MYTDLTVQPCWLSETVFDISLAENIPVPLMMHLPLYNQFLEARDNAKV